ncbi:Williams-Beuren syndrome chromosomal region 14 protein-like protein [Operophtera brumata]|uniref:Williams-Beuren syndrome chromosomal region 14 protein-like protein n=1 Tax=Operophtera brumata TaxID=104452 RepID=A0A0L7LTB9_OPEBR|nr:Williams-Beuren syndrome chromosomal region 14 protein-like protein [Operophtera brumata]
MGGSQYYGQVNQGSPNYESRGAPAPAARQSSPQMQYLQPSAEYKAKPASATVNARSFKMPSPPVTPQEQYRSHSLPLGSQLNADWSVSTPAPAPAPPPPLHEPAIKHTCRTRSPTPGAIRVRSRSTSGGAGGEGGARRPPPLTSVASEPTLPQASVMLAQLLSAQHSQSLYKLSNSEEGAGGGDPTKSPVQKGQPSPIGSDPRRTHLHAEQKRRYNIKNGFDTLQALIPHLNANPAAKYVVLLQISKAAMLQKGAEYIKQLKAERNQIKEEMESLRQQIESTGAPVSRARAGRLREMFARHVANRTMHNWNSGADLVRTTLLWAEQHCSLVELRPDHGCRNMEIIFFFSFKILIVSNSIPAVLNSLRVLCTTTDILTNAERLPEEARAAVAASAGVKSEPA